MKISFYVVSFFCFFLCNGFVYSQQENVWAFGYNAGINFNTTPPGTFTSSIHSIEAAASVCDPTGQLLFYTDGNKVWDRYNNLMPNGDTLITDIANPFTTGPTVSTAGGAIIVPYISDPDKYYIFSMTAMDYGNNYGRLYYSTVSKSMNGGLGDVVITEKGILIDSLNSEHLTAVVGDRCNIWLLTIGIPSPTTLQLKAYEITDLGVNNTPVVSTFTIPFALSLSFGQMDVSFNRDRIAVSRAAPFVSIGAATELYSFDPATGMASNHIMLDSSGGYGLAFSPDGSKLYKAGAYLGQYDLSLSTTAAVIGSLTNVGGGSGFIKKGPDGRMYLNDWVNGALSAITYPDMPGTACGFIQNAISFSGSAFYSLPNIVPVITHDTFHHVYNISAPCFAESTMLAVPNDSTGWDYVWSTGVSGTSATVSSSGAYYVGYRTPPCNYNVDTFHVKFETRLPNLSAISGCYNQNNGLVRSLPYPGDTATYIYTWKDNSNNIIRGPLATQAGDTLSIAVNGGTYFLHILAPNGCDTVLEIDVPLPDYHVSFSLSDTIVCVDQSIIFQNTSTADITGFNWNFGDGVFSNDENPQHEYGTPGLYTIQLIGRTGFPCYDTAYTQVVVDTIRGGAFEIDRDSICTGEAIEFIPQTDTTIVGLEWYFGDGSHILDAAPQSIRHAYDQSGNHVVTMFARSRACPSVSYSDTVHVFPLPVVNLGYDSVLCLHGSPAFLQNLYTDNTVVTQSMRWSTGDTAAGIKVVHPGKYSLTVVAAPIGCSTTDELEVKKDCYIDIPNVFTPNSDGLNDYFFPRQFLSRSLTTFKMQVFNRWGQVIFETSAVNGRGWDGNFNGKAQPEGVYIYLIEMALDNGRMEKYQANVTLIR